MLGELIVIHRGVRSLALHSGAGQFICSCFWHHLTPCTYRRSLSRLVDSSVGVLPSLDFMHLSSFSEQTSRLSVGVLPSLDSVDILSFSESTS